MRSRGNRCNPAIRLPEVPPPASPPTSRTAERRSTTLRRRLRVASNPPCPKASGCRQPVRRRAPARRWAPSAEGRPKAEPVRRRLKAEGGTCPPKASGRRWDLSTEGLGPKVGPVHRRFRTEGGPPPTSHPGPRRSTTEPQIRSRSTKSSASPFRKRRSTALGCRPCGRSGCRPRSTAASNRRDRASVPTRTRAGDPLCLRTNAVCRVVRSDGAGLRACQGGGARLDGALLRHGRTSCRCSLSYRLSHTVIRAKMEYSSTHEMHSRHADSYRVQSSTSRPSILPKSERFLESSVARFDRTIAAIFRSMVPRGGCSLRRR